MNTLVGAAEPPEHQPPILSWTAQFSLTPARCSFTGISFAMGCRGPCCRPDLHLTHLTASTAMTVLPRQWPVVNTAAANPAAITWTLKP